MSILQDRIDGPKPLGCRKLKYKVTDYTPDMLFQGDLTAPDKQAAQLGFIDEVIHPRTLRMRLHRALELLRDKRESNPPRKHGNIPL